MQNFKTQLTDYPKLREIPAVMLVLVGLVILAGWSLGFPRLTALFPSKSPTTASSAFCFVVAGIALLPQSVLGETRSHYFRTLCGSILIGVCVIGAVTLLNYKPWHPIRGLASSAGLLNTGTLVGFAFTALALFMLKWRRNHRISLSFRVCTAVIGAVGTLGVLSYVINMDYLYVVADAKPMALATALLFLVLSGAVWNRWKIAPRPDAERDGDAAKRIYRTIEVLVTLIVATVALVTFGLSQGRTEQVMLDQMSIVGKDKRTFFASVLDSHLDKVIQIATRPAIVKFMQEYNAEASWDDPVKKRPLVDSANSFVKHGFTALSYIGEGERVITSAGTFLANPELSLLVSSKYDWHLLWQDGYTLRVRLPIRDETGQSGFIVTEQRLPELTQMHREAITQGETGDLAVCSLIEGKQYCYPFRWSPKAGIYNAFLDGNALPLTRAIGGETATDITTDFRRQRVMAALGPIGTTKLGMAVKRDMTELYSPVRKQFLSVLPFLLLLIGGSVWLIRSRVHPLVNALAESQRELRITALHDSLTGLPNRSLFNDRLSQAIAHAKRTETRLAVLYIDLDHFKDINDTFGHGTGDEVLKWVSNKFKASIRASDTVARFGGDEFTVITENVASPQDIERIAEDILKAVSTPDACLPKVPGGKVMASIGISLSHGQNTTVEELLTQADTALYESKRFGRNRFHIFGFQRFPAVAA